MRTSTFITLPDGAGIRLAIIEHLRKITASLFKAEEFAFIVPIGDETTALSTGTAKVTFRAPFAMSLTGIRASLSTAQSSGTVATFDVNVSGTTILSTKLTVDNSEKTSTTAGTAAVISTADIPEDAEVTIDVDAVGTGGAGPKITFLGVRS